MTEKKLTKRQTVFVEEYLQSWNASDAARRAGYKGRANTVGPRLLLNVGIQERIAQRMEELAMPAKEVLTRLSEQASVNIAEFLIFKEKDGRQLLVGINWEAVQRRGHLVKSIVPGQWGIKLELHDGQTALIAMAKRHQLLSDKTEHHVDVVEMTLEEWKEEQKRRKEEAEKVIETFEDGDDT